jgi:Putative beta barrel porin-7 (BBP7)
MKKSILLTIGAWLASTGITLAEDVPQAPAPAPAIPVNVGPLSYPVGPGCGVVDGCQAPAASPHFWASGEYLLWWVKSAPIVPLATAGSANDFIPGALGQPNTQVISPTSLDYAPFSGGRATIGAWLDPDGKLGFEASGFLLETRSSSFIANTPPGNTVFYVPFFDPTLLPPGENTFPFGSIGATQGAIAASESLRLWGGEANGLFNLINNDKLTLSALGGFRYLDLSEDLNIGTLGAGLGGSLLSLDRFSTRNQFWGGQLGVRGEARFGGFFVNVTGKIGLGDMHESVNSNGVSTSFIPGGPFTVPGGFFVQGTNNGRRTSDVFSVVPEVRAQIGYDVTNNVRVFVGYDYLYVSDVVRPGDQIDRQVNFTQQAAPVSTGALVGPAAPLPQFNHTEFWAQGVSFGLGFRF